VVCRTLSDNDPDRAHPGPLSLQGGVNQLLGPVLGAGMAWRVGGHLDTHPVVSPVDVVLLARPGRTGSEGRPGAGEGRRQAAVRPIMASRSATSSATLASLMASVTASGLTARSTQSLHTQPHWSCQPPTGKPTAAPNRSATLGGQ
jgi:hypothetical protein